MEKLYRIFKESAGVCTDTRKLESGQIFFALKGENFDGNKYAQNALKKGAVLAVVDDPSVVTNDKEYYLTKDVLSTLQKLANYHRKQFEIPFIAITGSNGKTTTKELLTQVLSQKYKTSATKGNLNNHIGVPLTLLDIKADCEIAIIEMGANHQGEIAELCRIAEPTHGLITNVGRAHLEGFGGVEGVLKGKTELYRYLDNENGIIFIRKGDVKLESNLPQDTEAVFSKGLEELTVLQSFPKLKFKRGKEVWSSKLTGIYNLQNIDLVSCVASFFDVPDEKIKEGVSSYIPANNRSQVERRGSNTYILDHYNANPSSMKLAIENIASSSDHNKKVLILGDMRELGAEEVEEHMSIISLIDKYEWFDVILVGEVFNSIKSDYKTYPSSTELKRHLDLSPIQNALILLKGSRGIALERIL